MTKYLPSVTIDSLFRAALKPVMTGADMELLAASGRSEALRRGLSRPLWLTPPRRLKRGDRYAGIVYQPEMCFPLAVAVVGRRPFGAG